MHEYFSLNFLKRQNKNDGLVDDFIVIHNYFK